MGKLEPPPRWGNDKVTSFFKQAEENSYATFVHERVYFKRLVDINDIFCSAVDYMENSKEWFALLFFLKAHSAFLASLRLAVAPQLPETFILLRGALENSLYGWYIFKNKKLAKIWLERHESDAHKKNVKNKFKIVTVLDSLDKDDSRLGRATKELYERCIDYGAHPNEKSLSAHLRQTKTVDAIQFDLHYLSNNLTVIKFGLKSSAQAGVLCLKILELIIPERFKITGLDVKLENASKGL